MAGSSASGSACAPAAAGLLAALNYSVNVRHDLVIVYVLRPTQDGRGHEILQLRRRESSYMGGTWQFCGGKIEPGETAAQAALRELEEETNLFPRQFSFLSHIESFYLARTDTVWHRIGFCAVVRREDEVQLNDEHTAHRWIGRPDLRREVTWPGERASLAEIFREHLKPGLATQHRQLDPYNLPSELQG